MSKSKIFFPYEKSASIDLVYSLVTNYSIKAKTVVELSLNKFFNRQHSSVTKAISGYYRSRNHKEANEEARKMQEIKFIIFYLNLQLKKREIFILLQ